MHPICPVLRKLWLASLYGIITYHLTTKTSSLMVLPQVTPGLTVLPQVILHVCDWMHTDINHFGLLMNIQTNHLMIPILQFILKMCPTTTRFGHLRTSHNPLPNPPIILLPGHLKIC